MTTKIKPDSPTVSSIRQQREGGHTLSRRLPTLITLAVSVCVFAGGSAFAQDARVTLRVIPRIHPVESAIHITGNQPQLRDWYARGVELEPQPDGSWSAQFSFQTGTHLEYKFTRGTWQTEAVDPNGIEFPNFVLDVTGDTTVTIEIPNWRDSFIGETILSAERLQNKAGNLELYENWRYHSGDDTTWADPDFDDRSWELTDPSLRPDQLPESGWNGIGWFRLRLSVDSTLWHVPLAFYMLQTGASEVYLDGHLLYRFGVVGASVETERAFNPRNPGHIIFADYTNHVLAVRYSNHQARSLQKLRIPAGFSCVLGELDGFVAGRTDTVRRFSIYQMVFTAVPLALAMVHFLLFAFYPRAREHLFYALSMAGFAVVAFTSFNSAFASDVWQQLTLSRITDVGANMAIAFGLLTVYSSVYPKFPKRTILFLLVPILYSIWSLTTSFQSNYFVVAFYAFAGLVSLEIIRVIFFVDDGRDRWVWITGLGFTVALLAIIYQVLINIDFLRPIAGQDIVYVYGVLILGVMVSINLSRDFARTHHNLEEQIVQVKELSRKALEQERHAREEEIARRVLEADHARKTQELEEARQLQLAMLPKDVPKRADLDIDVYMKPATEVGGDYYDFIEAPDRTLTVAIGDATGHGMKAGTMVASIKSLFTAFGHRLDIPEFFNRCTDIIKGMHLGNLYMAMMLVRIKGQTMEIASAGMPPVLIYRYRTGKIENLVLKGMPLGGHRGFHYRQQQARLEAGDTVLLMSDGFMELFNSSKEMLDYTRVRTAFGEVAQKSPTEIIAHLVEVGERWCNGRPQDDDITFIAMKSKGPGAPNQKTEFPH